MAKDDKKPKKKHETLRKPVATIDFSALAPAIVENKLVVDKSVQLVLARERKYEMITLCRVLRTYNDGTVVLQDETIGELFLFNLNTDTRVHERLRVYDKSKTKRASVEADIVVQTTEEDDQRLAEAFERYVETDPDSHASHAASEALDEVDDA